MLFRDAAFEKVMSRDWWNANNDFLPRIFEEGHELFREKRMSQTDLFYEIRNWAAENEEVKARGITKEEVNAWEWARYKYFVYPEKVKIST
jgi:hypothetical protein